MPKGNHTNHARGIDHPRWNQARMRSEHGYVKVRVGKEHCLADPNGYVYEHLLVWCSAGMPRPLTGELLHHRNHNKQDNRLENLEIMTRADHNALHNKERSRDLETGRFLRVRQIEE
jgi:hypothetical protein